MNIVTQRNIYLLNTIYYVDVFKHFKLDNFCSKFQPFILNGPFFYNCDNLPKYNYIITRQFDTEVNI